MKIGQASQALAVSSTTIRNYLRIGDEFYSESATRKKGKNITSWDLNQLMEVQRFLGEGVKFSEIHEHLEPIPDQIDLDEPEFIQEKQPQDTSALLTPDLIEQIHQVYQITLIAKDDQITELRADKLRLQAELTRERRPWYQKLLGRD
jgi:DNA-binding transcriptional MerR regulator